ncbi:polyamine aminopropyltransferase [Rheinheimera sp. MMS21-TC3]|uniref:polyamine aminopropyltransferase n=1 Tax=Rheinheimera sp. MMS21-TC3 TaxID=3072790 RepID=UPI0028C3E126|nr:polyamine aminopropyltransferase [Rheinheimera sp. MMS21-TC3]WNO59504.1 polyamine aminopropyltransferase [Rheinheimera sp. MMS21-TC3]
MSGDNKWYTEIFAASGSAFGLAITKKLDEVKSPFQHIEMFETTHFGNLMVIDDVIMLSSRDNFLYHEMLSHPVLFTHDKPKNVVIIGGGDCGTLREVLKHPDVEKVTQIDIDEQVTRMSEKYFPELCASNDDPRATLKFDDGIKYMREAEAESIDVIIVDSTDPIGPGEGLFNRAFYDSCRKALKPNGILVQQSESPLIHMPLLKDMRDAMSDVGFSALQTLLFPQMVYPSGWWTCTLARKEGEFTGFREADAERASFNTEYYNVEVHKAASAWPNFMKKALNRD